MRRHVIGQRVRYLNAIPRSRIRAADQRFPAADRNLTSALKESDRV